MISEIKHFLESSEEGSCFLILAIFLAITTFGVWNLIGLQKETTINRMPTSRNKQESNCPIFRLLQIIYIANVDIATPVILMQ